MSPFNLVKVDQTGEEKIELKTISKDREKLDGYTMNVFCAHVARLHAVIGGMEKNI